MTSATPATRRPTTAPLTANEIRKKVAEVQTGRVIAGADDEGADDVVVAAPLARPDPRHAEEWTFSISYTSRRGKAYEGEFTNRILSVGEANTVQAAAARLALGVPFESLSPSARQLNEAIAHMSVSLFDKDGTLRGPEWARDLRVLFDPDAVIQLWSKVIEHETAFFRLEPPSAGGEAPSAD